MQNNAQEDDEGASVPDIMSEMPVLFWVFEEGNVKVFKILVMSCRCLLKVNCLCILIKYSCLKKNWSVRKIR